MSWSISVIANTAKIPKKCAQELWELDRNEWCSKCEMDFAKSDHLDEDGEPYSFYCYDNKHREKYMRYTSGDIWDALEDVTYEGKLSFNPDHMEHMDYLGNREDVYKVLMKHKVKGDICFGSLEGDNEGSFWGYRFDGKGGMKPLEGTIEWSVNWNDVGGN